MKITDQNNLTQREALLNECKGNLFEFLVAQGLSRYYKKEDLFLLSLPRDFRNRLKIYEETIRASDEQLLLGLPTLANAVVKELLNNLPFKDNLHSFQFQVIGKMVATNANETWNETDIVAIGDNEKKHFISLKLTKDHSFTNTKSAGAKSFIEKYFKVFPKAVLYQSLLSSEVDESFQSMGHKLYADLDMDFRGQFDSRWTLSELPGELSEEMRAVVHANYNRVSLKLHELLNELLKTDRVLFKKCLEALCGFGDPNILQVHCFHQQAQLKEIAIKSYGDLFSPDEDITMTPPKNNGSSFDVKFKRFQLQIRVKPMNKFTTASYKINCSIKLSHSDNTLKGDDDDV